MNSLALFLVLANIALAQIVCPADHEQTFVDPTSGAEYRIECGYDRPGGDIHGGPVWTDSLEQCIALCSASVPNCVDVTYVPGSPGPCYLKYTLNTPVAKAGQNGAYLLSAAGVSCPNPNPVCVDVPDEGTCYYTECDSGRAGDVLAQIVTISFEDCIDQCEAHYLQGCTYVNFAIGQGSILPGGTCTLQTTYSQTITPAPGSWGATRESICFNQNGANETTRSGRVWQLECGTDLVGGDIERTYTGGIFDCMIACDETPGCVAAAWHWGFPQGACYLKSQANPGSSNLAVNAGVFYTTSTTSSTTSSTSSSSTTSSTSTSTSTSTTTSSSCTATATGSGVLYGDFECGVPAPWSLPSSDSYTTVVDQPGLTGNWAVNVESVADREDSNPSLISPIVPASPSTQYKLTWGAYIEGTSGDQNAFVNGRTVNTIEANQYTNQVWVYSQVPWTSLSTDTSAQVSFDWELLGGRLDTVMLSEISAWCGSNPPLGILPDGEFECGLGAWTVEVPDPGCSAGALSNAAATGGKLGQYAWVANLPEPPVYANTQQGVNARIYSTPLPVVPGTTYMLSFVTYFTSDGLGFIGAMINGVAIYTRDPADKGQNGPTVFSPNTIFWTADAGVTTAVVRIEALFGAAGTMMVDGVIFTPVNPAWAHKYGQ